MIRACGFSAWVTLLVASPVSAQVTNSTTDASDIVVTGSIYRGDVATGGARIGVEVRDLPLSISVVTEAAIEDRQIRNIREVADNVAGVFSRSGGAQAFSTDFAIRGFVGYGGGISVNGFRVDGYSAGRDPQTVERVEFLKGPASVLYGAAGALSGLANIVTKSPRHDDFLEAELTGGQLDYARAAVDANVRLTGTLDARLNAATTIEGSRNAFRDTTSQLVAPALRWHPTDSISILAEGSYFRAEQPTRGAATFPNQRRFLDLPSDFKLGERSDLNRTETYGYHVEASWQVAPGLTLRQGVNTQYEKELEISIGPAYPVALDGPDTLLRSAGYGTGDNYDFASQTEVRWTVATGPFRHKLLFGYERRYQDFSYTFSPAEPFPSLDLRNPTYGFALPDFGFDFPGATRTHTSAFYGQDFVELGDHWKLLAGLRYDMTKAQYFSCSTAGCLDSDDPAVNGASEAATENALSPRLGLVWRPSAGSTLFASYSKSFAPNAFPDRFGKLLPPERGTQYEVGIRQDLAPRHKLTLSLAAFDLTRSNIAVTDPVDDNFQVAVGEQRSKGLEAELTGKPTPWIDLVATFAYIDAKVTKSDFATTGIREGSQLPESPRYSASLFSKIDLVPLGLDRTSFSVGAYYLGRKPVSNGFYVPDFASFDPTIRVDLGLYHQLGDHLRLQANITNLLGEKIYEPANIGFRRETPFRATVGGRVTL